MGFGAVSSSCKNGDDFSDEIAPMYACPTAKYRISARVVDAEGNPIKGIELRAGFVADPPEWLYYHGTSDEQGCIDVTHSEMETPPYLRFEDTDGEANGGYFDSLIVDVEGRYTKIEEGEGWYRGSYELELGDVTMTLGGETEEGETEEGK